MFFFRHVLFCYFLLHLLRNICCPWKKARLSCLSLPGKELRFSPGGWHTATLTPPPPARQLLIIHLKGFSVELDTTLSLTAGTLRRASTCASRPAHCGSSSSGAALPPVSRPSHVPPLSFRAIRRPSDAAPLSQSRSRGAKRWEIHPCLATYACCLPPHPPPKPLQGGQMNRFTVPQAHKYTSKRIQPVSRRCRGTPG